MRYPPSAVVLSNRPSGHDRTSHLVQDLCMQDLWRLAFEARLPKPDSHIPPAYVCPGRDLNPHSPWGEGGFKPPASASFATRAHRVGGYALTDPPQTPVLRGATCAGRPPLGRLMNRPEIGADPIRIRGDEPVCDDHPLDHVGEHGRQRAVAHADGDHRAIWSAPDGAIGADQTRGATKTGRDEPMSADMASDLSRHLGEVHHRSVLHEHHLDAGVSHNCSTRRDTEGWDDPRPTPAGVSSRRGRSRAARWRAQQSGVHPRTVRSDRATGRGRRRGARPRSGTDPRCSTPSCRA
jgi:hypothetical protein